MVYATILIKGELEKCKQGLVVRNIGFHKIASPCSVRVKLLHKLVACSLIQISKYYAGSIFMEQLYGSRSDAICSTCEE